MIPDNPTINVLDGTKLDEYITCPRKYFYSYVLGWRPETGEHALVFGGAVHTALEYIYDQWAKNGPGYTIQDAIQALALFEEEYRKTYPEETDEIFYPKNPECFSKLLTGYIKQYRDDSFEVVNAEISGCVPIYEDGDELIQLYFRLDTLIRQSNGSYAILEHKTSGWGKNMWEMGWDLRIQPGTGAYILYLLYGDQGYGTIMNGLIFKRNKDFAFDLSRVPVPFSQPRLEDWRHMVEGWIRRIRSDYQSMMENDSPEKNAMTAFPKTGHCIHYNRLCPFYDYCFSWQNPLKHVNDVPSGFVQKYWDPREMDKTFTPASARRM